MTDVRNPRFAAADGRVIAAERDGATLCIPAHPANADYAELLASGAPIAPFQRWATLDAAKADLAAAVDAEAERLRFLAVGTRDPAKLAIYQWKAEMVADGDDHLEPIEAEAAARGIAPTYLAALIRAKAVAWRELGIAIDAAAAVHKAAIAALIAMAEAEAYDATVGWPEAV